jgi:hypothetical protein
VVHTVTQGHPPPKVFDKGMDDKGMDDKGIAKDQATAGGAGVCTLVYISGGESQYLN